MSVAPCSSGDATAAESLVAVAAGRGTLRTLSVGRTRAIGGCRPSSRLLAASLVSSCHMTWTLGVDEYPKDTAVRHRYAKTSTPKTQRSRTLRRTGQAAFAAYTVRRRVSQGPSAAGKASRLLCRTPSRCPDSSRSQHGIPLDWAGHVDYRCRIGPMLGSTASCTNSRGQGPSARLQTSARRLHTPYSAEASGRSGTKRKASLGLHRPRQGGTQVWLSKWSQLIAWIVDESRSCAQYQSKGPDVQKVLLGRWIWVKPIQVHR